MTEEIDIYGRKKRKHVTLSAELEAAVDELLPDYANFSTWSEQAILAALVEEYGSEEVKQAVETARDDLDDDEVLPESRRRQVELPATS